MDQNTLLRASKLFSWTNIAEQISKKICNNLLPVKNQFAYAVYSFYDCSLIEKKYVLDKKLTTEESIDNLAKYLNKLSHHECYYVLLKLNYTQNEKSKRKFMLILFAPDFARIEPKMKSTTFYPLYCKYFKDNLEEDLCEHQISINYLEDFNYDNLKEKCLKGVIKKVNNFDFSENLMKNSLNMNFTDVIFYKRNY